MAFNQGSGGFGGRPREMHKATCADCKKECEVPFKPREDRPVYCKDCFAKRKDASGSERAQQVSPAEDEAGASGQRRESDRVDGLKRRARERAQPRG